MRVVASRGRLSSSYALGEVFIQARQLAINSLAALHALRILTRL